MTTRITTALATALLLGSTSLVAAQTWPGNAGTGIVRPRPLAALTPIVFSISGATTHSTSCATTVPGVCSISYQGGAVAPGELVTLFGQ